MLIYTQFCFVRFSTLFFLLGDFAHYIFLASGAASALQSNADTNAPLSNNVVLPSSTSAAFIAGLVAVILNVLIMVGLGFYCLRRRFSSQDIDDFIEEENAATNVAAAAREGPLSSSASTSSSSVAVNTSS